MVLAPPAEGHHSDPDESTLVLLNYLSEVARARNTCVLKVNLNTHCNIFRYSSPFQGGNLIAVQSGPWLKH